MGPLRPANLSTVDMLVEPPELLPENVLHTLPGAVAVVLVR